MSDAPQRFGSLAAQFEVMAHDLKECQNSKQRRELLVGMMVVLNQIECILMNEQSLVDSKPDGTAPSNPPLSKAAHQSRHHRFRVSAVLTTVLHSETLPPSPRRWWSPRWQPCSDDGQSQLALVPCFTLLFCRFISD